MKTIKVTACVFGNIASSVGLILINKVLMEPRFNFSYIFTLTALHFLMTAIGMEIIAALAFERKRLPYKDTVLMSLSSTASIVLMNYSLRLNSIGYYQLSKLLGVPWLICVQQFLYHKSIATKYIVLSLCLILVGVGIVTVSDVRFNLVGIIISILAVVITVQYQIWQGEKQSKFNLNELQVTHAQSLPNFIACGLLAVIIDGRDKQIFAHVWSREEIGLIFLGCLLAMFFNLSAYGIIGRTSPLTYQVVGLTKTLLVFSSGFYFDSKKRKNLILDLIGLTIAMLGIALYTLWSRPKQINDDINEDPL